jgi:predicted transcriptional regulator
MKLKEYVQYFKIQPIRMAYECNMASASIYAYIEGKRKPHQKNAEKIEKNTKGLVTVMELRGQDDRLKVKEKDTQ